MRAATGRWSTGRMPARQVPRPAWSTATGARSSGPGERPGAAPAARHREQLPDLVRGHRPAGRDAHGDRARPARPRRLRQAARRLLDRRLRQRDARPALRARHRAGDGRRPLPRRRDRAAVRLPVPRALPAAGAGRQRRAGPGALRRAAGGHPARRRAGAHRADRRLRSAALRPAGARAGRPGGGLAAGARPGRGRRRAARRSRTSRRGGRSCARCAASSTPAARRSPRSTGSTSPTPSRMLVVWGSRDPIVPALHAETVRALVPSARIEVFDGAGHWPHLDEPDRFCDVLLDFIATTEPAAHDLDSWRRAALPELGRGAAARRALRLPSVPSVHGRGALGRRRRGGGPAGAACAAGGPARRPAARVLVLDRAEFPRDKVCGDGIAPEALDVLAGLGIDPRRPDRGIRRRRRGCGCGPRAGRRWSGRCAARRASCRAPSSTHRLLTAALASGAEFRRHVVRRLEVAPDHVEVDGVLTRGGRRRGRRRGVGRPPGARHRPEPAAPAGDRDPRLRAGAARAWRTCS